MMGLGSPSENLSQSLYAYEERCEARAGEGIEALKFRVFGCLFWGCQA